jgi:diaminohydroxyphosphoribosylaminopyrimidine deaminase/5-amino-6-(5-phosphoribosylamino)uracil reductase
MNTDLDYLSRAFALAERGLYTVKHNPRVGCVIVKDNKILGEGWHQAAGEAHAEINALNAAGEAQGATCYITLEPCTHYGKTPPCVTALIQAGIKRVVIASLDPNPLVHGQGVAALQAAGISVEVLLAKETQTLNPGFFQRMQKQRPYVRVKLGMSLDGRTALANGKSQWITSEAARQDVQQWRARSCAVLTSSATVIADNPQLNVRDKTLTAVEKFTQPLRVVVDTQLSTSPTAQIYQDSATVVLTGKVSEIKKEWQAVKVIPLPVKDQHVDLPAVMQWLAEQQINEVWVEAGAQFVGALAAANLVDEWVIYIAPKFLGPDARPLMQLPELKELPAAALEFVECIKIGEDLRVIARHYGGA